MKLEDFCQKYPKKEMKREPFDRNKECYLLKRNQGPKNLNNFNFNHLSPKGFDPNDLDKNRYLWVIKYGDKVPFVLEGVTTKNSKFANNGKLKHSNLTGCLEAHSEGELWFHKKNKKIYYNGCSGQYGPESIRELQDIGKVFNSFQFTIQSFGWDEDANSPARFFRGNRGRL